MATTTVITAGQFIVPGYPFGTATAAVNSLTSMPGGKTKVEVVGMTLLADVLQGGTGVNFDNPATFGGIAPDNSATGGPTVIAGAWPTTTVEPVQQTPIMNYCVIDTNVGLEIYKIVTVLSDTEFVIQGTVPAPATTVLFLADKAYGATSVAITCTAGYLMGGLDQALVTMPAGSITVGYGDDRVDPFLLGSIATDVTITLDAMVLGGTGGGGGGGAVNSVTATAPITSSGGANPNIAMPAATALVNGYLKSTDWTTFNNKQNALTFGSITTSTGGVTIGSGNNSTVGPNVTVDIATASALATGLLSSADWSTFNGKQNALSFGNLTEATSSVLTITGGTGSVIGGGTTIQVKQAGAGQDGFLSSADWSTFNSKQSALTFSTGLTNAAGTVTANLSTGIAGGQIATGGTGASDNLTLRSTTNATKGKILFGTSAYDEVNNRLGIGTASPGYQLTVVSDVITADRGLFLSQFNNGIQAAAATFQKSRGTIASPSNVSTNDLIGAFSFSARVAGTYTSDRALFGAKMESTSSIGLFFNAGTADGSYNPGIYIHPSNNVLIGSSQSILVGITDAGYRLDVNGTARIQERLTVSQDNTVATQVVSVINTDTANCGMVIAPSGSGGIMMQVPDGGTGGGLGRGTCAIDFQAFRTSNNQVASGSRSFIGAGESNRSSGTNSIIVGGSTNFCSGQNAFIGGGDNNIAASTASCIVGGSNNNIGAIYSSVSGGFYASTHLYGQRANASGLFAAVSDAQTSSITLRRSITGQSAQELTLDGAAPSAQGRAILSIAIGPTNARAWRAQIDVVAIVSTVGNGTVTLGDCFMGSYHVGIKRIGNTTSLVGAVSVTNEVSDAGMAGAAVTITADDTNEALKIEFTPATNAGTTTVTRVVATAYLTEVGY